MKKSLLLITLVILITGCKKIKEYKYTVVAEKPNNLECVLEVNDIEYHFSGNQYEKEVILDEFGVGSANLDYIGSGDDNMTLSLYRDGSLKATVSGNSYIWIVFTNDNIEKSQNNTGTSTGSNTSSYCGAPTKDGTPCKRKVSGGGYCWQHK